MAAPGKPPSTGKKSKLYNSRTIRTELLDPSYKNGGLNIPQFIASRQYEIKAFEQSQLNTKAASATRVFQNLPRTLRRRTASHNVKRIPKKLRAKGLREMQNTTNGVPAKKQHSRGRQLHRLKLQKRLLRLASKIKDSRGVPISQGANVRERIQNLNSQLAELKNKNAMPLNNTVAAFDRCSVNALGSRPSGNMKYASRQRQFTWMPTHVWHAKRFHMTKRWGFQIPFSPNQKCFRSTSRAAKSNTLASEASYYAEFIAECLSEMQVQNFINTFTRYSSTIPEWLMDGTRAYNGWIYVDNQKLAPGVIVVEPSTHKIMVRLHPSVYEQFFEVARKWAEDGARIVDCRYALGSIELRGPTSLHSLSKILHIEASNDVIEDWRTHSENRDPCLIPKGKMFSFQVKDPRFWKNPVKPPSTKKEITKVILENKSAVDPEAVKALFCSEYRTNSYKDMFSIKQIGKEFSKRDPKSTHIHAPNKFPMIIFKTSQESWCVIMPWFWVQPLWSKLISVTGVYPVGLRQAHQINFEHGIPTFPQDFPHLPEGYREHLMACTADKLARDKLPSSKQKPLERTEGVLTMSADWYFLWKWTLGMEFVQKKDGATSYVSGDFDERKNRVLRTPEDLAIAIDSLRDSDRNRIPLVAYNKHTIDHQVSMNHISKGEGRQFKPLPVVQVVLTSTVKGMIKDNARIYQRVSNPSLKHLIGFVTSGGFNFRLGCPTAIALISAEHKDTKSVLLRNVGCTSFTTANVVLA